ncbi:MAG: N-formylglutamate amidohydrolase [Thermodesulfobacteriota bacterium]|jgi:predicted N-formylglutamate amidohydrolase
MAATVTYEIVNPQGTCPLILTCEHASWAIPSEYQNLGLSETELRRHIGWDIGARVVVASLVRALDAPAVCAGYSRLLIDCNRDVHDHDLIVPKSDGTTIPGNRAVSDRERQRRIERFYWPYHEALDQLLAGRRTDRPIVCSIHSFTPVLRNKKRDFDVGVLFDRYEDLAQEIGQRLAHERYRVRYNEPYSGYDGLIFSARSHGDRHGLVYIELEINNELITETGSALHVGRQVGEVLRAVLHRPDR